MKGLCALKKERKEKVHSFTQRFAAYLKNFSIADKPSDKILIEYYTSDFGPDLAMFSKMKAKPTFSETYEEAKRVEAEKESIEDYSEPKEEQSRDLEGMLRMMHKLSNRVIDLETEKEAQKAYKPYYERRGDNNQSKPPPHSLASMKLTEVGMDNFCTFHQQPHSAKIFPQWINSLTLVVNQLLDSKLTEDSDEEEKGNKTIEKQENDTMFLWDCVSLFDT